MKKYLLTLILFTSAFIFTSCMGAYTDISGTWTKPGYKAKKYNKILVVGISDEIVKRNTVETAFVNELGKDKIKSSTSNELVDFSKLGMNEEGKIDSVQIEELKKKVNEAGYDGAIVISLLDIQEKTDYVPGQTYYNPHYYSYYRPYAYRGFYNYYYTTYSVVTRPGYYVNKKSIYIETRLYNLKTDEMVWACTSETMDPSNLKEFSKSLAGTVVSSMLNDYIIK